MSPPLQQVEKRYGSFSYEGKYISFQLVEVGFENNVTVTLSQSKVIHYNIMSCT